MSGPLPRVCRWKDKVVQKALKAAWPPYRALVTEHFSGVLSAEEAEQLAGILHRVIVSAAEEGPFGEAYPQRLTDEPKD